MTFVANNRPVNINFFITATSNAKFHTSPVNCLRLIIMTPKRLHNLSPCRLIACHRRLAQPPTLTTTRNCTTETSSPSLPQPTSQRGSIVPLRKQLKDEAKRKKLTDSSKKKKKSSSNQVVPGWELTVGIEIHAQLNTAKKLFSTASTPSSLAEPPNTHVAPFDAAIPGSQPQFQTDILVPAVRAALALGCTIQRTSTWDRKHYFWWDQPQGYQITQYYRPFARNGRLRLASRDGIAGEEPGGEAEVRIERIQMEQDTAKTVAQPGGKQWVDLNRAGVPLVEIITAPDIRHPATAAALVRKVQRILWAVDACVIGMEEGGLRADVNVSVRQTGETKLGMRTEIKNLSSFRAVEDAVVAERDRQIAVLSSAGGKIGGETRGWTLGGKETYRIRGKEGEVDYRYMPDPDLAPLVIADDVVEYLRDTMGVLPDEEVDALVREYGLTAKDAMSLVNLDDGRRVEYFYNVIQEMNVLLSASASSLSSSEHPQADVQHENHNGSKKTSGNGQKPPRQHHVLASNWILHELGRLSPDPSTLRISASGTSPIIPAPALAELLSLLHTRAITSRVAKDMLFSLFDGSLLSSYSSVTAAVDALDLRFRELSQDEYLSLCEKVLEGKEDIVEFFRVEKFKDGRYPEGKLGFLVGRMMRLGEGERVDPKRAKEVMRGFIERLVRGRDGGEG